MQQIAIEGAIDSLTHWGATGWAWMPGAPDQVIEIEAVLDGRIIGRTLADQWRPDLAEQSKGPGRCGFVLAFTEYVASDAEPLLQAQSSQASVRLFGEEWSSVAGYVDIINPWDAAGWAWMPSAPDQAVEVEAVLNGTVIGCACADQMRVDIAASGRGSGRYGFTLQFITPLVGGAVPEFRVQQPSGAVKLRSSNTVTQVIGPSEISHAKDSPTYKESTDSMTRWRSTGRSYIPEVQKPNIDTKTDIYGRKAFVLLFGTPGIAMQAIARHMVVLVLQLTHEGFVVSDLQSGNVINYVPQTVHAILYDTAVTKPEQLDLLERWRFEHGIDAPLAAYSESTAELVASLAAKITLQSKLAAEHLFELAKIRQLHEELQNSYDEMRSFLTAEGNALPKVAVLNEPDEGFISQDRICTLLQPLPIDYRRLAGVSLFCSKRASELVNGEIEVCLFSTDDEEIAHTWLADIRIIPAGWVTFAFDRRKGVHLRKNVALRLTVKAEYEHELQFAYGTSQVRKEKAAVADGVTLLRALAFKCWVAPSGTPLTVNHQMWPAISLDGEMITRMNLDLERQVDVEGASHTMSYINFQTVLWDPNRHSILVHPTGQSPTVARLRGLCPAGTRRVVAEVETGNEKAGIVEYAMMIEHPDQSQISPEVDEAIDWVRVPAVTATEVHLDSDVPLPSGCSLLLMTRLAEGASPDYSWAHFKRIAFEGAF